MKASELQVHETKTIVAVGGERAYRRRLLELGLVPGTPITLLRVAPLGDPLELEVRGACLSIRRGEAALVEVDEARA